MDSLLDKKTFYLNDYVKIDFEGDKEAVKKLLQGQITSDIEESGSTFFQPSAMCDVKGFVIADFLILNAEEMISVIIHNSLAACLKAELEPMLPFYKTSLKETKICCLGFIGNKKTVGMPISFLQTKAEVSLKIDHQEEKNAEHLNFSEWKLGNYLNGNIFLNDDCTKKYRPHELGYDKSRVSFNKGCFKGQEIIARVHYKSKKEIKLKLNKTEETPTEQKVIGEVLNYENQFYFYTLE
ncbi:MAG: hypothetical protein CBC64_003165 [Gammaproteobacteria bacterium TMED104]|nr:MAG: hypothetical protein CBC64_003165 [Gammaproteobacteria bacterium TMED104]|tara:strand:- start:505 stop:1221 length:717 start_codon:yes stop_codon:yes gene_type:complete